MQCADPEEVFGGSSVESSILDLGLFDKVVCALNRSQHALDGEEGSEVGSVC